MYHLYRYLDIRASIEVDGVGHLDPREAVGFVHSPWPDELTPVRIRDLLLHNVLPALQQIVSGCCGDVVPDDLVAVDRHHTAVVAFAGEGVLAVLRRADEPDPGDGEVIGIHVFDRALVAPEEADFGVFAYFRFPTPFQVVLVMTG